MGRLLRVCAGVAAGLLIASPGIAQTSDYNPDVAAFVGDADRFVALLHGGTTLGHWLDTRNPDDQWGEREQECASYFTIDHPPSGILIPWILDFYVPAPPFPLKFPDRGSRQDCVLGAIQVQAQTHSPELAKLMDSAMRDVITYRYGQGVGEENVPFWGPFSYPDAARWINHVEIISGHSTQGSYCDEYVTGDTAFVCAHSELVQRLELDPTHSYRYRDIEDSQFHSALAIAGADPVLTAKLQDLYQQILHGNTERIQMPFRQSVEDGRPAQTVQPPTWLTSLLPLLEEWLAQLKTLPADRRAAGLLAADRLVLAAQTARQMARWSLGKEPSPFEKLGAEFFPEAQADGYYVYAGNWAEQARSLDPNGVVGQMAIIGSMARGSCDLSGPDDPSRRVILEGERLLSKGLDAPTAAQVHLMVGDAYSDFVALVRQGLNAQGARDPDKYRAEAEIDRAKALEHYRAGLAVDNASQNAQDAWRQAWRLLAGVQPEERYVCFDDGGD
jgi:hypothetical protein